ncbi:CHAT domain-containing protein [Oscillochloris sp. ZM17-4]|uniref:CHAT domain-containing protein n=1 Tax=Oscillochloris sp. ZM17-4 TaxID=2866714 RepID=UPI001C73B3BE|nr:CHAT domain-containing protein [Oscillochloris sp. ZM17-4]
MMADPHRAYADLELILRRQADGATVADLRLRALDSGRDSELGAGLPVRIDAGELRALALDPDAYGRRLSAMLFGDPRMREAWVRARSYASGAAVALRVRLRINPGADDLNSLYWETLRDMDGPPLCRSERVLFSRYLDTDDLGRVTQGGRPELRVLAAIANPSDLARYGLSPVDAPGEAARVRVAMGDVPLTLLGRDAGGSPASAGAIIDALRQGHPLLYLVCHGTMLQGRPVLWLEDDSDGQGRISGEDFARRIGDLPPAQRPLLVVLASCQSAGSGHAALAAVGPALARAGVAAVLAMQGNVPARTIERLMPAFFRALLRDGEIDRALAIARADLADDHPWWMPALFMQMRDGRLWAAAPAAAPSAASEGLLALADLASDEQVRAAIIAFGADFQSACDQIDVLSCYKRLHDLLQQIEDAYGVIYQHARRLPGDDLAWEDLEENEPDLQTLIAEVLRVVAEGPIIGDAIWSRRLERTGVELGEALAQRDVTALKRALVRLNDVIGRELSRMNAALVAAARTLRLEQLITALTTVRDQLAPSLTAPAVRDKFEIFAEGVGDLSRISGRLATLVGTHDTFQEVDDELRRVKRLLTQDVAELIFAWEDIRALAQELCAGNGEDWAARMDENRERLDAAMATNEPIKIRRAFHIFYHYATLSFNKVDRDLLTVCTDLQRIGLPAQAVLKMLA